ncbi:MAG: hypothetical protein P8L68_07060 [Paracoccaceae bacterium]|nr:hypothetical protein [Paracoccaceae bacterium]MDG2258236.1 hypothetical protein [Paracoccaceae bacterium]
MFSGKFYSARSKTISPLPWLTFALPFSALSHDHIFNHARFSQKADFNQVSFFGTDIDWFTEIANRAYVLADFKCRGTGMGGGQRLAFSRLVNAIGASKPCFMLTAEHSTDPSEAIHGDNSYVTSVLYRLPAMHKYSEYIFDGDCPSLNEWLSDLSFYFRLHKKLKARPTYWEELPAISETEWEGTYKPILEARRTGDPNSEGLVGGVDVPVNTGFFSHIKSLFDA